MHLEGDTKEAIGTAGTLGEAQQPPPPHPLLASTPMTADQDPRRRGPSASNVPACALRCGPPGAPEVAGGVHADDENQGREVMENIGTGAAEECLTPHPRCGAESLSDQGSPVPLARRPPQVSLSGQDSEMSSPNMDSSMGTACTVVAPSESSTDGSEPCNSPPSGKKAMPRDPNPMPAAKRVRIGADGAAAIDCDNPNQKVEVDKIKAPASRELPTIRQLKLWLARDEYVAGACFFYATALSLHALRSETPLTGVDLRVQATTMYRERCGIEVKESALSVCRALEEKNREGKPWGGKPDHFRHLSHHIDGKVVLLRTNTHKIMDSRFGPDTAVTSAAIWSPGMGEAKVYHTIQEMEEACEQACVTAMCIKSNVRCLIRDVVCAVCPTRCLIFLSTGGGSRGLMPRGNWEKLCLNLNQSPPPKNGKNKKGEHN